MMRSVWAVLAGFIFIGLLAFGSDAIIRAMSPGAFNAKGMTTSLPILILMMFYSSVYGVVGCYIAARLAPAKPMMHAMVLGVIGVIVTAAATSTMWGLAPAWFNVLNVVLVLPLAWLGGRLRENELRSGSTVAATAVTV